MSVSHTDTLEINNDADPAEAPETKSSTPVDQSDAAELSTTETTATEESAVFTDQTAEVATPASESVEYVSPTSDMVLPTTETNIETTLLETQSTDAIHTEIAELAEVNVPEQSLATVTSENNMIKDVALNEALTTPSADTVAVAEAPTQFDFHLPFSTDWIMVLVFFLTTVFLFLTNRRQIKKAAQLANTTSQPVQPVMPIQQPTVDVEFEKARVVAENRQKWMHSLREEVADFVSATNAIWDLHKIKDGCEDILTEMNDPQFVMKELYHWSCTYNKAVQDTEQLYTKIHLLINPKEEKAQTLCKLLDRTMVAVEAKKSPSKINDDIIAITQEILKDEWERVKTFS